MPAIPRELQDGDDDGEPDPGDGAPAPPHRRSRGSTATTPSAGSGRCGSGRLEKAHSRGDQKQSTDQHHQGDAVHVAVEDRLEEKLVTKPSRPSPPECRRRPRRPPWRQGPRRATGPGGLRDDDAENDSRHEGSGPGPGCSSGQTEGRRGAARWWRRARKCRAGPAPPHRRIPTGTSTSPATMSRASHPARERGGTATPETGAARPSWFGISRIADVQTGLGISARSRHCHGEFGDGLIANRRGRPRAQEFVCKPGVPGSGHHEEERQGG